MDDRIKKAIDDALEAARRHEGWLAGHYMPSRKVVPIGANIGDTLRNQADAARAALEEAIEGYADGVALKLADDAVVYLESLLEDVAAECNSDNWKDENWAEGTACGRAAHYFKEGRP